MPNQLFVIILKLISCVFHFLCHKALTGTLEEIRTSAFSISVIIVSYNKCFALKRAIPRLTGQNLNKINPKGIKTQLRFAAVSIKEKSDKR